MELKQILFATNNRNKINEIQSILGSNFELISLKDIGCNEELPETQNTLEGNALEKASYVSTHYNVDCFADDTGLEIDALGGRPGVYSARYAGEERNSERNSDKVLNELTGITDRKAKLRTVIVLIRNGKKYQFEGEVKGVIAPFRKGNMGFGYDAIFMPNDDSRGRSFAEMTLEEKNAISHRAKAFKKLIDFLNENNSDNYTENEINCRIQ